MAETSFKIISRKVNEIIKLLEKENLRMVNGHLINGWKYKFSISHAEFKKRKKDIKVIYNE